MKVQELLQLLQEDGRAELADLMFKLSSQIKDEEKKEELYQLINLANGVEE